MRNPYRLYKFYDELRRIHMKYFSDWRFGQLCSNFLGWIQMSKGKDFFFIEESEMLDYLREFADET